MKIAVYGDSFANLTDPLYPRGPSWVELLAQHHDVTNFGKRGSSLMYSYLLFRENADKFDKNIFLITDPNRYHSPFLVKEFDIFLHGLDHVENNLFKFKSGTQHIYESLRNYYLFWRNDQADEIFHNALVEKMKRESPNTFFIKCFSNSTFNKTEFSLKDVWDFEMNYWGYFDYHKDIHKTKNGKRLSDVRTCHLTDENNECLADKILSSLGQSKLNLSISDFKEPKRNPMSYYLVWQPV